jgi:hypothetical protein
MAYPVSSNFRTYIEGSHKVSVLAQICDVYGNVVATLKPLGGSVSIDIDRSVRRDAADMQLIDPDGTLRPNDATDILSPLLGYELRLYRGVEYLDGTTELVPLGVFNWSIATVSETETGVTLSIGQLQDRSVRVSRARYTQPINVVTATAVEDVITSILLQAWSDISFDGGALPTTGLTVPACAFGVEGDSDPWEDARKLADDQGYRLFFDAVGNCTMLPISGADEVTAIVSYGSTYGNFMITSLNKTWDTSETYNGVIAVGEGSGLLYPFRSIAWDDDPQSPTYYLGSFGKRPRYFSSPTLYTQSQADNAAATQLKKTLGIAENVTWSQLVDPSLDVNDGINLYDSALGIGYLYRIDRLTIPLDSSSAMTAEARTRRVVA